MQDNRAILLIHRYLILNRVEKRRLFIFKFKHIRHLCRTIVVLLFHRYLSLNRVEKRRLFKFELEL